MFRHICSWKRVLLLAAVAGLLFVPVHGLAEPKRSKQDRLVVEMVTAYLRKAHLRQPEIDDKLSKRLFKRYFNDLDPTKLYFLKEDIDEFKKQETELDD